MTLLVKIKYFYKSKFIIRFIVQILLIALVYFSIRYWKSLDDIKGISPVIQSETLNGYKFDLREKKSKPILVHFWATWCPICKFENPNVVALNKDYQVITIASWSEGKTEIANYKKSHDLDFSVIVDEDGEWAKLYGVKSVPASFFIDRKGMVRFIEKGYTSEIGFRLRMWWLSR